MPDPGKIASRLQKRNARLGGDTFANKPKKKKAKKKKTKAAKMQQQSLDQASKLLGIMFKKR